MRSKIIDFVQDGYTPEAEAAAFMMLSGKMGEDFINTTKRKRKIEDYGKLLGISIVFHLRRVFLRLIHDGESRVDEILGYLDREGKNLKLVDSWIMEAIQKIPDQKLKQNGLDLWNGIKKKYDENNFDLNKLF